LLVPAVDLLVDVRGGLAEFSVACLEDEVAVGVDGDAVRAGEGKADLVGVSARGNDEIIFELVSGAW
jgi:hypothetical protein